MSEEKKMFEIYSTDCRHPKSFHVFATEKEVSETVENLNEKYIWIYGFSYMPVDCVPLENIESILKECRF